MSQSQIEFAKYTVFVLTPLLIILIFSAPKLGLAVLFNIRILLILFFIGLTAGLFHLLEYDMYDFLRDMIYFVQAPAIIALGAYLCVRLGGVRSILRTTVICSFVITLSNLSQLLIHPEIIFQLGLETRYEYTLSNNTAVLAFAVLYYAKLQRYNLFRRHVENIFIVASIFLIAISFSRTYYVITAIILLLPYLKFWKLTKTTYLLSIFIVVFVLFGGKLSETKPVSERGGTLLGKFSYSLTEITVRNLSGAEEINNNWRGYEAFLGLSKYYEGNLAELLFGQGYGAIVSPPHWLFSGDLFSEIPVFHNGYITILLKTGIVGLFLFFFFMYRVLKMSTKHLDTSTTSRGRLIGLLGKAFVFFIVFQTLVVHGVFFTTPPFMLLILMGAILQEMTWERYQKAQPS